MTFIRLCVAPATFAVIALLLSLPLHAEPPKMLFQNGIPGEAEEAGRSRVGYAILRLPDGTFAFYDRYRPEAGPLQLPDRDGTMHTLLPQLPDEIAKRKPLRESGILALPQVVLTATGNLINVRVKNETLDKQAAAKIGLRRYLDVWVHRATPAEVLEPRMIWRGYNGSQMEYQQVASGRTIVPFGSMQPHASPAPPTGRHKTVIQYSDDQGLTWRESSSKLISPCYPDFNGLNEGACEPAIEQLGDGRIWMLMRTQAGFLYESFSEDDGATWQPARASRFNTSTGPPNIMRHSNGWLVVCWNNCEMPPRANGQGVYGGRDALHIAVSDDEGQTWRGFREIYLDHRRNDNPAKSGDRGTAYPLGAFTADGKIVMLAGQGTGGRNPILVDPDWITETKAFTDFSDGLAGWSVYKHHGPATRWWRARAVGCELIPTPSDATDSATTTKRCLHVRKPDALPADGATWNFPNGWSGSLATRVMLPAGSAGATLCLNDRMFDPTNAYGEQFAVFQTQLGVTGEQAIAVAPDQWYDVILQWNLAESACAVLVDGKTVASLPMKHPTLNGISYVRFRSSATAVDKAGFLVDSVKVVLDDPTAPACSPADQREQERRYVKQVVPTWRQGD